MMMETAAYSREFLLAKDLFEKGEFGELTFLRGTYYQDLEGDYPDYWRAQPPMHYATHASAPIFALTGRRATAVRCMGSGRLRPKIQMPEGNTFPLQSALFELEGTDIIAEVTRSWFQVARSNIEAFSVYGDRGGFEWEQLEGEGPVVFKFDEWEPKHRRNASARRVQPPYRPDLLPAELHAHMEGWHGGSHPHLVHEFISSIVEARPSAINAKTAADWTAPGICANNSSLLNGVRVQIPNFA
jgi:predicted dehydrogenase